MTSRVGSILIFAVILAIVVGVVVLILTLDVFNANEPESPLVVVSLDDGELVLLDDPRSITVTISSGNPIATLELFVDGQSLVSVLPSYSPDRGAYIGTFVWTPSRLGFAELRIAALDAQGIETERRIRVEVTDDQARVAAALRLQVLGIQPLQQFITGTPIRLALSATGSQPIERFDMFVDGSRVVSVTPALVSGEYVANIDWTPGETGEVDVTITAIDAAGREESLTIPVVLVSQGGAPDSGGGADDPAGDSAPNSDRDAAPDGAGAARIDSPQDGQRFTLGDGFDAQISAPNVTVQSALLYITPVAPDGTLGISVLVHSSESGSDSYQETIEGLERWIAGSGSYELQLVVFTPESDRYDDRVVIHVVAAVDEDEGNNQTDQDEPDAPDDQAQDDDQQPADQVGDEVDLAIVTARQADDDLARLNVSITNASTVDIERTDVLVIIIDSVSGAELGSAAVTLSMDAGALRSIPLELELQPTVDVDAVILLEAAIDADSSNNTFQISLAAPPADEDGDDQQEEDADSDRDDEATQTDPPAASPDLTFLDAQSTRDGFVLFTVVNEGDAPAESFYVLIADESGNELELVTRRAADDEPLLVGDTEILTSQESHAGVIVITVVASGDASERNLANNAITLTLPD